MYDMSKYSPEEQEIMRKQKAAIARDQKTRFKDPQGVGLGESPTRRDGFFDNAKNNKLLKQAIPMPDTRPNNKTTTNKNTQKRNFMSDAAKNKTTTATGPEWKQYKSIAAAKAANSKYYMGKDGKKKAAIYKGDLDKSLSKRDAYNKALGLKRADGSAVEKAKPKKDAKATDKKTEPKKKSFRERRLDRMGERLASAKSEGRKRRIKRRMERVEGRIADDKKKPKKKMAGGMMKTKGMKAGGKMKTKGYMTGGKFPDLTGDGKVTRKDILKGRGVPGMKGGGMKTKGYMAGGKMKTKGYSAGGVKKAKAKKLRGAGIESRGYRPVKMR